MNELFYVVVSVSIVRQIVCCTWFQIVPAYKIVRTLPLCLQFYNIVNNITVTIVVDLKLHVSLPYKLLTL